MSSTARSERAFVVEKNLNLVDWAEASSKSDSTSLHVSHGPMPVDLHGAPGATGRELVTNQSLGADLLRIPAGSGFVPHTHPGHHLLVVIGGTGTITYDGQVHQTQAGQTYMIDGAVPHAVGAITDHVILAVGSPHKPIDSEDRMAPVPYEEVLAEAGDLTCLICSKDSRLPDRLHSVGCPHCPCGSCLTSDPDA